VEEAAANALLELSRKEAELRESILARKQELADIGNLVHAPKSSMAKEDNLANAIDDLNRFCGDCVVLKNSMKSTCNERMAILRINFKRTADEAKKAVMMEFPSDCIKPIHKTEPIRRSPRNQDNSNQENPVTKKPKSHYFLNFHSH